jgi:hypothetical protein
MGTGIFRSVVQLKILNVAHARTAGSLERWLADRVEGLGTKQCHNHTAQIYVGGLFICILIAHRLTPSRISNLLYSMSKRTIRRYLDRFYQLGDVQPLPRRNGPKRLLGDSEQVVQLASLPI